MPRCHGSEARKGVILAFGIERGYSKPDRLKAGATPTEGVNRSVSQFHADLIAKIAVKKIGCDKTRPTS